MAIGQSWKDRRRISKRLSREAWDLYNGDENLKRYAWRALLWAAVAGVVTVVVSAIVAGAFGLVSTPLAAVGIVPLFIGSWISTRIVYQFYAALTAEAAQLIDGNATDYERGLAAAAEHGKAISRWALVQVIVGWILAIANDTADNGIAALIVAIITAIVGVIWSLITFFVMPVIMFEGLGTKDAIVRSKNIARDQWGKSIRGAIRITVRGALAYTLPGLLLLIVGVVLFFPGVLALIPVGVVLVAAGVALMIVGSVKIMAARYVFGVALYRFATGSDALGPFDGSDLAGAVRSKR